LAFVGLSVEVDAGTTTRQVALLRWVHSTFPAWLEVPMQAVTALAYYSVVAVVLLVAAYLFFSRGLRLYAFFLVLSTSGDMILTTALKIFNHQPRPHLYHSPGYPVPSSYSFPSGHAGMAVGFWGLMWLLVALELRGWRRWVLIALGAILALLIGFSRIYLGVHYPTDVLGGYLLATCWAAAVGTFLMLWNSLRKVRNGNSG
jgi:undecaprenyl-diphosphatase